MRPPVPRDAGPEGNSFSKKPRRVCRPQVAKKFEIIFRRGMYVAKNTSKDASVRVVRPKAHNECASRRKLYCRKAPKGIFDSLRALLKKSLTQ